ncbi:MAG TPA: SusC/RagA family TonB-linked outer membrane protein [Gemmatimonadaceae bacterium]|nr:SusC/RagA family TonB-linked outer membrane protein [Gemmatimonadaceae bacterium]
MGRNPFPFRTTVTAMAVFVALAFLPSAASAQTAVFTGKITSQAGQPLGGASIGIPDLGVGGIADANGNYTFTIDVSGKSGRTANVVARYIGYKPKRLPVTLTAGRVQHDFVLERDVLNLEEVIVTGTSEATSQKKATFSVGVVDNTQLKEVPSASPLGGLQGKIPGASVITVSGQPGSEPSIRLRSATSLTGRQDPLVIVDGTISRLSLADINSEDIERIEVIKGAAASSLYGSDAANGVIQIFTKRGASLAEGQTSFTFRNEYGQNNLPKVIEGNMSHNYKVLCGASACTRDQAGTSAVTAFDESSGGRTSDDDLIADNRYPVYYDQLRKVFRPAQFLTNYVSVGQRRGTTNFNASFQNQRDAGVLNILKGYNRQNFRLNVDQSLTENIDLNMGAFYGRSHSDQGEDHGIFFGLRFIEPNVKLDSIAQCGNTCPYNGAYNPLIKQAPLSTNVVNPLYVLSQQDVNNDRDRFTGTFKATYRPVSWLTGEANVGYDEANVNYRFFQPKDFSNSGGIPGTGDLQHRSDADRAYNTSLALTSVRSFWNDQIRNTSKAAYMYEDQTNTFVRVEATGLEVKGITEFGAAKQGLTSPVLPTSQTEAIRAKNLFFVTTFDIKDRYVIDGLIRRDQSSLFGSDERSATYHRLSGAWRVTEDFSIPGIDELKLRASHGTAGLRPSFSAQYEIYSVTGGKPVKVGLGNNQLKPAFSSENEYGFNVNFLTNYSIEYNYSQKRTTDQIIKVPLSAAAGYKTQWQNAGSLEGHTHELAVGAVLVSKADRFWRVNMTADRTRQKITDLKVGAFLVGPFDNSQNAQMFRIAKGEPFGVMYGDKWIKTAAQLQETIAAGRLTGTTADYQQNEEGFFVRKTAYHTITEVPLRAYVCTEKAANGTCITSNSVQQIADVNPDATLGFSTTAQWKSVSLNSTVSWTKGGQIYNYTRQWPFNELRDKVIDQSGKPDPGVCAANWATADPTCPYKTGRKPTTYYSTFYNNFNPNDYFVEDGSYVRLRELALNYNLPAKWASKIPVGDIRSARIGLVGRNLWTSTKYTGYDPDVTAPGGGNPFAYRVDYFTYPAYRTFTAMLEFGF